jgi:hypothetical protein
MEEDDEEEEGDDDNMIFYGFAKYGAFDDTAMGEAEEEIEPTDDLGQAIHDVQRECESKKDKIKFKRMPKDHRKLLYPTVEEGQKKLGTTLELLQWKAKNGVSNKRFGQLVAIQKKMLPKGNELSATTYEAKQVICPLGLEIQNIHACPSDCILYRGKEYEKLDACPVCHASWYKIRRDDPGDVEGKHSRKRISAKVMWYA